MGGALYNTCIPYRLVQPLDELWKLVYQDMQIEVSLFTPNRHCPERQLLYLSLLFINYMYPALPHSKNFFLNHPVEHWATELFSNVWLTSQGNYPLNLLPQYFPCWIDEYISLDSPRKILENTAKSWKFLSQHHDHVFALSIQWFCIESAWDIKVSLKISPLST